MTRDEELVLIEAAVREGRITKVTDEMVQARPLCFPGSRPVMRKPLHRSRAGKAAPKRSREAQMRLTCDANKGLIDGYTAVLGRTTIRG